jgi:ParB family transcriptional regulator, chromosome partitioning protein
MSDRTKIADAKKNLLIVPLGKLKKSPKNVRKVPHTKAEIRALAASIGAIGMLQYPVVEPEIGPRGKPTGFYLVNAGEGRRLAQVLRVKKKEIKADEPIPCILDTEHNGTELSLAENAVRCDMHPADQYEAFAKLHNEDGMSAEDIAARFGVTPAVVRQRLKLGAVSPKLMALYRKGGMKLDQLSAFAITEDHERQERVWSELPQYQRSREAILRALSEGQVRSDERRALFVGAKAYEAAGGVIVRDLFDQQGGGYFTDAELLNRLAREKLEQEAESIAKEGWRWVMAEPELDRDGWADMRRVFAKPVPLSKTERKRLHKLEVRHDALCDKYPSGDLPEGAEAKRARIETAIADLRREEYKPQEIARAGAFVYLARDGEVCVERGFVRPEDEPQTKKAKANGKDHAQEPDGPAPLSEKLVAELTAYRTSALRNELAQHPQTALLAVVHAFTLDLFYPSSERGSCLEIGGKRAWLTGHAPGIDDSPAEQQTAERHAAWAKRMPEEFSQLWTFLHGLSEAERLNLLAHCVSQSVNALQIRGDRTEALAHADLLAREVGLDMAAYWQPSAANYLTRVSKERILEALREGGTNDVATIAKLKKPAMAEAAEKLLLCKGWLPVPLRLPEQAAA